MNNQITVLQSSYKMPLGNYNAISKGDNVTLVFDYENEISKETGKIILIPSQSWSRQIVGMEDGTSVSVSSDIDKVVYSWSNK